MTLVGLLISDCYLCIVYVPFTEGLNAEYVKGEHMEGVVSEEPQGKVPLLVLIIHVTLFYFINCLCNCSHLEYVKLKD